VKFFSECEVRQSASFRVSVVGAARARACS
jgi:hypothetical protein